MEKRILTASEKSFNALIDFLEQNGNPVLGKSRWHTDKEGMHAYMSDFMDIALIKEHFIADASVIVNEKHASISTVACWMDIHHWPGLQYDPAQEGTGGAYFYPKDYKYGSEK